MDKKTLQTMSAQERAALLQETKEAYAAFQAKNLKLNMARGVPAPAQLDLTADMMDTLSSTDEALSVSGDDARNYGLLSGIPEAKQLFADVLGAKPEEINGSGEAGLEASRVIHAAIESVKRGNVPVKVESVIL